jgi:hypothetical protein
MSKRWQNGVKSVFYGRALVNLLDRSSCWHGYKDQCPENQQLNQ